MLISPYITHGSGEDLYPGEGTSLINVALSSNGGVASSDTNAGAGFLPSTANDGLRHTNTSWGGGGGWSGNNGFPETFTVLFGQNRHIEQVDIFFLADALSYNVDPEPTDIITTFGETKFVIEYLDTSDVWVQIYNTNTDVDNDKVWFHFEFSHVIAKGIRAILSAGLDGFPQIVEFEAWGYN